MNNFKTTFDGGLPLVLNDFRWQHTTYLEAFKAMLSAFGNVDDQQAFILIGCERTVVSAVVTIAEGYVSIGGEPYHVPEHSYGEPTGGDVEYWTVDESSDPSGSKVFQSTAVNDTYAILKGKISVGGSVPPGSTSYQDTPVLGDAWRQLMTQTVVAPTLLDGTYTVDYKKDVSGFVHFRGHYHTGEDPTGGVVNVLLATLPDGYRPAVDKLFSIAVIKTTTVGVSIIQVGSNGEVRIKFLDSDYVNLLDFSQIPPFEAV